jgi:hypothetical protein
MCYLPVDEIEEYKDFLSHTMLVHIETCMPIWVQRPQGRLVESLFYCAHISCEMHKRCLERQNRGWLQQEQRNDMIRCSAPEHVTYENTEGKRTITSLLANQR